MKKWAILLILSFILFCFCGFTGCGFRLPENMEEAELDAAAENVIALINADDYGAVYNLLREDVREQVSVEYLQAELDPVMEEFGAFLKIKDSAAASATDEDSGEQYVVVMVVCSYENGKAKFNLTYDLDMQLIGLYVK